MEKRRWTVLVCFACFMLSTCQLMAKAFACALCSVESNSILVLYLSAGMAFMFGFKLWRGDYMYWLPVDKGPLGAITSFVTRLGAKVRSLLEWISTLLLLLSPLRNSNTLVAGHHGLHGRSADEATVRNGRRVLQPHALLDAHCLLVHGKSVLGFRGR